MQQATVLIVDNDGISADQLLELLTHHGYKVRQAASAEEQTVKAVRIIHSEDRYRVLIEQAADGIFVLNQNGVILEANTAGCALLGFPREVILYRNLYDRFITDQVIDDFLSLPRLKRGETILRECWARHRNGTQRPVEISSKMLEDGTIQIIARDISDRKKAEQLLREKTQELSAAYDATLQGWSSALEMRERETAGHSQRVVNLTFKLALILGMNEEEIVHIQRGALLHDIGKMGIPDVILRKPGPLTEEEWAIMRMHPVYAYQLLSKIPYLHSALDIPYCHHERWDGTGYPRGLAGEEIPFAARIFSVIDVWDALLSDRPYRAAWTVSAVKRYLQEQAGKQFDPRVVHAFLNIVGKTQPLFADEFEDHSEHSPLSNLLHAWLPFGQDR